MSSEEEDYMSDAFLVQCDNVRPGLAPKQKQKQYEKEHKEKESNKRNKTVPLRQLEKDRREAGLSTGISQSSKGFALLQKMGYKPGMGIGKTGEGRKEPVSFEVKTSRSGLGKDSEMKRKSLEMNEMRATMLAKRKKLGEKEAETFKSRQKDRFNDRMQEKDLRTAQQACLQLDQQAGLMEPPEPFFWPANSLPSVKKEESDEEVEDELDEKLHTHSYNKHPFDEESDDDVEEDLLEEPAYLNFSVFERTDILTRYLRNVYKYCIWCGAKFDDDDQMKSMCPGNSAEAHDEDR